MQNSHTGKISKNQSIHWRTSIWTLHQHQVPEAQEQSLHTFPQLQGTCQNKQKRKILNITSDGRGEFVNNNFKRLAEESGINNIVSPPYKPQNNGIAERGNWAFIKKTCCLLLQSKLLPHFWEEAATTATMLCNLVKQQEKKPYQLWNSQVPLIYKLQLFGCRAWVQIPEANRNGKFDPVAWEGIFLDDHWNICADTFDLSSDSATKGDVFHDALEELPARQIRLIGSRHPTLICSEIRTDKILRFSRREHKTDLLKGSPAPTSFKKAIEGNDKGKWTLAINKELDNRKRLGVWSIEDKKSNDYPITTAWVLKVKKDHNNTFIKHKV
ncbi:hypothetical protein O181_036827 [Austropuccinia psidii MF-1]|uniref:Integrase catalytic domain-containing protein n=1 Tax=Austropuccinia psidii MF-1 TaxID=1389203 RepID=A0A9Q3HAA7_9BASI|nr:hypothetical protein [Austropuccinia psidii MF-1]